MVRDVATEGYNPFVTFASMVTAFRPPTARVPDGDRVEAVGE